MVLSRFWTTGTRFSPLWHIFFLHFFRRLTPQKFIDVIFSSLGYFSLQNLSKALPSVNYRPTAQFFPFSVFPALSSAWMKVWPLLMAKVPTRQPETGQATAAVHDEVDTGHNKTQNTNTPRWWLIESKSTFNLHVYWKSCWIFYSNAIPVCSTPCQLLNCIHPENENFSYSPTPPPPGGGGVYCQIWAI